MDELPPLPEPENEADTDGCTYACPEGFSADQMRAYAAAAMAAAYALGWCNAAKWADRVDLISDMDSAAYIRDRDAAIRKGE